MSAGVDERLAPRADALPGFARDPQPAIGIGDDLRVGGMLAQMAIELKRMMTDAGLQLPGGGKIKDDAHPCLLR